MSYDFSMILCSCYKLFGSFIHIAENPHEPAHEFVFFSVFKIENMFGIKTRYYEIDFA